MRVLLQLVFSSVLLVSTQVHGAAPSVATSFIALETVVEEGLFHPTYVAAPPDGNQRLFVLEQPGRIRVVQGKTLVAQPFLDITAQVLSTGPESIFRHRENYTDDTAAL